MDTPQDEHAHQTEHPPTTPPDNHENPQVLFAWRAPLRPFVKRGKNVLRFYAALALLISLIVFFLGDRILLIPIWTLLFLFYVLTTTRPPEIEHRLTQFGIESVGSTMRYEELAYFYFNTRFKYYILTTVTHPPYFHHSYLVVPSDEIRKKIVSILSSHVVYLEKPNKNLTDKMADALSNFVSEGLEPGAGAAQRG